MVPPDVEVPGAATKGGKGIAEGLIVVADGVAAVGVGGGEFLLLVGIGAPTEFNGIVL